MINIKHVFEYVISFKIPLNLNKNIYKSIYSLNSPINSRFVVLNRKNLCTGIIIRTVCNKDTEEFLNKNGIIDYNFFVKTQMIWIKQEKCINMIFS